MRSRAGVAAAAGALALVVAPISATWAQEGGATGGVAAVSQGWWSQLAAPPALPVPVTTPPNPLAGAAPVPASPAPDVPADALPVSMRLGQVDRVAAIGITMDAAPGSQVDKLVLHLKEASGSLAQQGSGAAIRACPISDFLVPEDNGQAANTPAENCDVAHADGVRGDDGTWTFDLTAIGQAWSSGAVSVNGLRFDPVGTAPATFQVSFTGYHDATFESSIVAGASSDAFGSSSFGGGTAYASDSFGSSSAYDVPVTPAPAAVVAPTVPPKRSGVAVAARRAASGITESWWVLLLLALGLGSLGLAIAWSMGDGAVATGDVRPRRQGRVSRTLGRRVGGEGLHA